MLPVIKVNPLLGESLLRYLPMGRVDYSQAGGHCAALLRPEQLPTVRGEAGPRAALQQARARESREQGPQGLGGLIFFPGGRWRRWCHDILGSPVGAGGV